MHQLEQQKPFSQSLIWQRQRDYFSEAGIDAWRSAIADLVGGVPCHNPHPPLNRCPGNAPFPSASQVE